MDATITIFAGLAAFRCAHCGHVNIVEDNSTENGIINVVSCFCQQCKRYLTQTKFIMHNKDN